MHLAIGQIGQGHRRGAIGVGMEIPLELQLIRVAAKVTRVPQHDLFVEDVVRRDHVDLALVRSPGRLCIRPQFQATDADHFQRHRQGAQGRIIVEGQGHVAGLGGRTRGQGTAAAQHADGLQQAGGQWRHRFGNFVFLVVATTHLCLVRRRALGFEHEAGSATWRFLIRHQQGVGRNIGHQIVADQFPISGRNGLAADVFDMVGVAGQAVQGFDGLVPVAAGLGDAIDFGNVRSGSIVQLLEDFTLALAHDVEQQLGIPHTLLTENPVEGQTLVLRVIHHALTQGCGQFAGAIGGADDIAQTIAAHLTGDAIGQLRQAHPTRVERVDQLRQGVVGAGIRVGVAIVVIDDFHGSLVVDVGQVVLGLEQGFASHQQGRVFRPDDGVLDRDRFKLRFRSALGLRQARHPGRTVTRLVIVDSVVVIVLIEIRLHRIVVMHGAGTGRLAPQLVLVVLEERWRRRLAPGLAGNEGLGTARQQTHWIRRGNRGASNTGVMETLVLGIGGFDLVDLEIPLQGAVVEVLEQHVRFRRRGRIQGSAKVGAQGKHRVIAAAGR